MKKVAIIIINYKDYAERFLADCIDSLRQQQANNFTWQLYIIDNASNDDSQIYLKQHVPEAKIIPRKDGNYSAANRAGIEKAMQDGCDYFVIANMDVEFDRNWLNELVKSINSNEKVGIAQSKVMLYSNKNKI